jgi:hypothetical protein
MGLTRPRYSNIVDTDYKASCRTVTTTNITLSGGAPSTYDGLTLVANDRILVVAQNTASQNGIYVVETVGTGSNGTWVRSFDANNGEKLTGGAQVSLSEGLNAGKVYKLTTADPITVGVTALTFAAPGTAPGGANTSIQFNNFGSLDGLADFAYSAANSTVIITGPVAENYTLRIKGNTAGAQLGIVTSNTGSFGISANVLNAAGTEYAKYNVGASSITFQVGTTSPTTALTISNDRSITVEKDQ